MRSRRVKVDYLIDKMHPRRQADAVGIPEADLTGVPLDQPFPDIWFPSAAEGSRALFDELVDFVGRAPHCRRTGAPLCRKAHRQRHHRHPEADRRFHEEWFETRRRMVLSHVLDAAGEPDGFVKLVLPERRVAGLFWRGVRGRDAAKPRPLDTRQSLREKPRMRGWRCCTNLSSINRRSSSRCGIWPAPSAITVGEGDERTGFTATSVSSPPPTPP